MKNEDKKVANRHSSAGKIVRNDGTYFGKNRNERAILGRKLCKNKVLSIKLASGSKSKDYINCLTADIFSFGKFLNLIFKIKEMNKKIAIIFFWLISISNAFSQNNERIHQKDSTFSLKHHF